MEIIATLGIVVLSLYIIVRKIQKTRKGDCNCGSCDTKCPMFDPNKNQKIEIIRK